MSKKWMSILLSALALPASAATSIDFDDLPTWEPSTTAPFAEQGVLFSNADGYGSAVSTGPYVQGHALLCSPYCVLNIEMANGSLFALDSLDVVSAAWTAPVPFSATLTGYFGDGSSQVLNLELETDWDYAAVYDSIQPGWAGLQRVELSNMGLEYPGLDFQFGVDNVVLTAVPIPAAVWLFGSAMAGLGFFRRRNL